MKKLFFMILVIAFAICAVSCGGGSDVTTTGGADSSTTTAPETTVAPVLEVGEISSLEFIPGDYSGTLTWPAFDGATGYDVYIKYVDAIGEMQLAVENTSETSVTLSLDYGRTTDVKVLARGMWNGEESIIAESAVITVKPNGVRANEFAVHDDKMYYYSPKISHAACGIVWINGEIWVSDGGNSGDGANLVNKLMALREEFLGDKYEQYANDMDCKLAVNLYITHYHVDHTKALINSLLPNRFFTVEEVHASSPESDPSKRPGEYAQFHSLYDSMYANTNSTLTEHEFGVHTQIKLDNSTATIDFYPALMDWSVEYYSDNGSKDIMKGWFCMVAQKGADSALTLAQNCNSMWAKFTYESTSILFTGDTYHHEPTIISPMLDYYGRENFDVDVLVYLHHGHTRYSKLLYDVTTPTQTVFNLPQSEYDGSTLSKNSAKYCKQIGSELYWATFNEFTGTLDGESVSFDREADNIG